MPKANIQIRPATISDASILLHFIKELAIYENAEHEVLATTASIEANIFSDNNASICISRGSKVGAFPQARIGGTYMPK